MNRKILLVDDERSIRDALSKVLRAEGYEIVLAENGQQAIEKHEAEHVDLLLLDIGLPVKDGWTALAWLSAVDRLLPVIIITGRWKQSERAAAARADVLMEKPLNVPMLLEIIRELLQEPPEVRARRIEHRESNFRHVPCDGREFCEQLKRGYITPYPSGEPSVPESPRV
jgi:DNA-binding response OmpR family regulator